MKVLLIGGTGLISTGITHQLLARGDEVWHVNRGLRSREFEGRVTTVVSDRTDHAAFEAQMQELPTFDAVVDMVGYEPEDARSLIRAFWGKCGHLVFCSTVDVYSRPASNYPVVPEEPLGPAPWDYSVKKAEMERIFRHQLERAPDQPFTILRPAHTYGDDGAMLCTTGWDPTLFDRLLQGKPILMHGDGQSLWASCHRDDVATAFVNSLGNSKAFGRSYSLPGRECVTWKQQIERIAEGLGAAKPTFVTIPIDLLVKADPRTWITSVNFAYNNVFTGQDAIDDLDFPYTVTLAEGARRAYARALERGTLTPVPEDDPDARILRAWDIASQVFLKEAAG